MNQTVHLRSPPGTRQQPLLTEQSTNKKNEKRRLAEVAGGTAAECAAICCCFPCTLMNLLILTVYKLPVGLCKKVWNKKLAKRRRIAKKNKALLQHRPPADDTFPPSCLSSEDVELEEKIMWDRFYGTGFWRTPSQRET
ncbi:uncharacterized protein LOC111021273 [Momordica charantia]|uniref:Uncharacterized protein LOC111021273 n=1 Tax=Momordica charantia TaxID=3673 RepID=A0A6J1DK41_MOMCH|nr:uncharacterized protein LOC111021273 [Momordica charantia]